MRRRLHCPSNYWGDFVCFQGLTCNKIGAAFTTWWQRSSILAHIWRIRGSLHTRSWMEWISSILVRRSKESLSPSVLTAFLTLIKDIDVKCPSGYVRVCLKLLTFADCWRLKFIPCTSTIPSPLKRFVFENKLSVSRIRYSASSCVVVVVRDECTNFKELQGSSREMIK